jgi:predicted nucleic acid-binding protein
VIGYLDTSAFVPLLIREPTSAACARFWDAADSVVTSRLTYVETAAALAQALRMERITAADHRVSLRSLEARWSELDIVEADDQLTREAAQLAHQLGLRGYDAVHCASARQVADEQLVAAAGDRQLLRGWVAAGLATYDTHQT